MRDHTFYRSTPALLQAVDGDGTILEVSDRWLNWLGYQRSDVIGKSYTHFISSKTLELVKTVLIPQLRSTGEINDFEVTYLHADGTARHGLMGVSGLRDAEGTLDHVLLVLTDISERKRSEQLLLLVSAGTANVLGEDFFPSLASYLAQAFGVRCALVTECVNQQLTRVRTLACFDNQQVIENFEYDLSGTPCEGVIAGSVCYYPEHLGLLFAREVGEEAFLGAPMHDSHGNVVGHLAIFDDKPLHLSEREMTIMQIFATRASAELERQRTQQELQRRGRELRQLNDMLSDYNQQLESQVRERTQEIENRRRVAETLQDLLTTLNLNRTPEEVMQQIITLASNLLGTKHSALFRLDKANQRLSVQASRGMPAEYTSDLTFSVEHSFLGRAVLLRQPVVIHNLASAVQSSPKLDITQKQKSLLSQLFQTLLAVPLVHQGGNDDIYGGIALYFPQHRDISDEEVQLATAFARQAALILENDRLRHQVEQMAVIEERNRLARELHDSVTQSLYSLTLLAEGWRRMAQQGNFAQSQTAFAELKEISQTALREMRLLIHELRPPQLEEDGLYGAIHQRLMAVERRAGIEARLIADEMIDLPSAVEEGLYRIVQEALNNMLKHAAASRVTVELDVCDDAVVLQIQDNGQGFAMADKQASGGVGLSSMRERANKLGGSFSIVSVPGQGTTVRVSVPLKVAMRR
ncbi:MAG: GAF domain-containing protein [Caldilineaceae bacterium]